MPTTYSWSLAESSPLASVPAEELAGGEDEVRDILLEPGRANFAMLDGDLVLATGLESIAQDVDSSLRVVSGEWFEDEDEGVPYHEVIFQKRPNLALVRAALLARILGRAGVREVTSLELSLSSDRSLAVTFSATTDIGELNVQTTLGEV